MKKLMRFLDPAHNALKDSPPEWKFLASIVLATFWCLAFGITTGELLFIGYSIIGHYAILFCIFLTWSVFRVTKKMYGPPPPNKVKWDLNKEA
jgi:hypothetical protein|tara:strand:+ start:19692 stop:19970 length:279 start_codon:yes stop_codon:yes gene_type:complete